MTDKPTFVYVTYIHSTPDRVWHALTDSELTAQYWGHSNVSDWQAGSTWEHQRTDGSGLADVVGTVLEATPPRRLVMTFGGPSESPSQVTFELEAYGEIVSLTVTHERIDGQAGYAAASVGWPAVMANLKTLMETGHVLPQAPWEMHAELRAAEMAKVNGR